MPDPRHVRVSGDLDLASAERLEAFIEPLFREPGDLTLHAARLAFIDSSGIRSLIRISLRLGSGRLVLLHTSPQLKRLFEITGVQQGASIDLAESDCCPS